MIHDDANAGYDNRSEKTDEEIKALLDSAIRSATNYDRTELSDKRSLAMQYYRGDMPDVPSQEGRSSVVSRDVSVIIGWMLPGIIRTFTQSGRIVEYEPVQPQDEPAADQASDYINHKFLKDNDGYRVLYSAIHDALLMGNGVIKVWWDDTPEFETFVYTGLTEEQLSVILTDGAVEVLAQDSEVVTSAGPDGQPVELEVFDVKIKREKKQTGLKFAAVEPENFLMDKESVTIDESRFVAHRDVVTKSSLVEMGFDRDVIDMIPTDGTNTYYEEEIIRDNDSINITDTADDSAQMVEIFECYIKMDVDGDGILETVKALYAGHSGAGELLEWELWEDQVPFVDIPCEPVPHAFDAQSIADQTMDLQRIKTVLSRQMLDNIYSHNNPQPEIEEGAVLNTDSIASPKYGQPIIKRRGSLPIAYRDVPFIADKALLAIQSVDQELERRTGISRSTMALDPDALQNQTATAVNAQKDASYSKVELVARNMAELGFRNLFKKALKLIVKHQDRAEIIRLRGNWVEMDPRVWNSGMDCTVNTGLGTGSRERDIAALNQTLGLQMNFLDRMQQQSLVEQGLQMVPKIIKTATKIAESSGLKNADDYFITMNPQQMQKMAQDLQKRAQQPSPEQQKIQAEMQAEAQRMQAEAQFKQQEFQGKMEIEKVKIQQQSMREEAQMNADIQVHQHEAELKAGYQDKELAASQVKNSQDHEIKLGELALKEKELNWKMQESATKTQLDVVKHKDDTEIKIGQLAVQEQASKNTNGRAE